MKLSAITGLMARRMLINWRIDPGAAARLLPAGIRPKLVHGHAIAGLCIVRLEQIRPIGLPAWVGTSSENVATRIAVEWDAQGGVRQAVLIFRRDTGSSLNHFIGSRFFPGVHHRASFAISEKAGGVHARMRSCDDMQTFDVAAHDACRIMPGSVFGDLAEVERFFRGGECGYSPARAAGCWDGVALTLDRWDLVPMEVEFARSSFFEDVHRFPPGSAVIDSAYILRDILHTWRALPSEALGRQPEYTQAQLRPGRACAA